MAKVYQFFKCSNSPSLVRTWLYLVSSLFSISMWDENGTWFLMVPLRRQGWLTHFGQQSPAGDPQRSDRFPDWNGRVFPRVLRLQWCLMASAATAHREQQPRDSCFCQKHCLHNLLTACVIKEHMSDKHGNKQTCQQYSCLPSPPRKSLWCQVGYNELMSVQNGRKADVLVPTPSTHLQPEKPRWWFKGLHHP